MTKYNFLILLIGLISLFCVNVIEASEEEDIDIDNNDDSSETDEDAEEDVIVSDEDEEESEEIDDAKDAVSLQETEVRSFLASRDFRVS